MGTLLLAAEEGGEAIELGLSVPGWAWAAFIALIAVLLIADLLLVHRTAHVITIREAAIESSVWITLGLSFTFVILAWHGGEAAGQYLSGYLIEKSLSIDNVFVWAVIFTLFAVPPKFQFRVLFWGVFGALVLRAIFIFVGLELIERFEWVLYLFGALLLVTAVRIARHDESEIHPERNLALRAVRKVIPSTNDYDGQKLFTVQNGKRLATPLFAVLILVESTDVVFAVDSIPAIFGVSRDQFIVFSSNAFAILGLRALYFLLAGMAGRFRYLNAGLGVILGFVGLKIILETADVIHLPTWASLAVISVVLTVAIVASLRVDGREGPPDAPDNHAGENVGGPEPDPVVEAADQSTSPARSGEPSA